MESHSLGDRVKAARRLSGMSRLDVEVAAGLTKRTLERVEVRGHAPAELTLRAIATALGTTADALRGSKATPSLTASVDGLVARHGTGAVLRAVANKV